MSGDTVIMELKFMDGFSANISPVFIAVILSIVLLAFLLVHDCRFAWTHLHSTLTGHIASKVFEYLGLKHVEYTMKDKGWHRN